MRKLYLLMLALGAFFVADAQAVAGVVLHLNSDAPVSDATVKILKDSKVRNSVNTDFSGQFRLSAKKGQNVIVEVSKEGYETLKTSVSGTLVEGGIVLRLQAKQGVPKFEEIKEGSVRKVPNPEIAESIGNLSNLPEGAKIVEVVPLEVKETPKSGFNVQPNTYQKSSVDATLLKQTFNKQAIDTLAFSTVEKFPASYIADGNIYFGPGKAMLTVAVETHLEQIAKSIIQKNSQVKILAYADAKQEAKVGEYIAKLRAEEVTKFLIERGVDFKQLDVVIKGNKQPENKCFEGKECSEFEHQQNRKVEIQIIMP